MIRSIWFAIVTVVATAFFSTVSIVGGLLRAPHGLHDWVHRGWARALLGAAGVRVEVEGIENLAGNGPKILVSNHQSTFDIFALFRALPVSIRFVAKRELARIPLLAQAMRSAGHVFIDREDRRGALRAMRSSAERMRREGFCLGLFPEGTRSRDGALQEFKKGSFVLAIQTQLPLVPIAVDGGWRLAAGGRLRPGVVRVRIGRAIPTEGRTAAERAEVMGEVRDELGRLLEAIRRDPEDPAPVDPGTDTRRSPDPDLTDGRA